MSKVDGMMYTGDLNHWMMVKGTDPEEIRLQAWLAGVGYNLVPDPVLGLRVQWFRCNPCWCGDHRFHVDPVHTGRQLRGAWLGAEVRMVPREDVFEELNLKMGDYSVRLSTEWRFVIAMWRLRP